MPRLSRLTPEPPPDGRCCSSSCHAAPPVALLGVAGLLLFGWLLSDLSRGASADPFNGFGTRCSCEPQNPSHPQMAFCSSDFVLKVHVLRRNERAPVRKDDQYWIEVKKVFRNSLKLAGLRPGRVLPLWIYGASDTCDRVSVREPGAMVNPRLGVDRSYLVTGKFEHGKLMLSRCSWISYWPNKTERHKIPDYDVTNIVSRAQSRYLRRGHYAQGCTRCRIEDSRNGTKTRHSCLFDSILDFNMCMAVHAFCGRYTNKYLRHSECEWQAANVAQYAHCVTRNVELQARVNAQISG